MSDASTDFILSTAVHTVQRHPSPAGIHAFAIDTPIASSRTPGAGVEVNGWVIGQEAPLLGARAVIQKSSEHYSYCFAQSPGVSPLPRTGEGVGGEGQRGVKPRPGVNIDEVSAPLIPPLNVRPDVAADYPDIPHAAASGFSFWLPLPDTQGPWHATIEAIAPDGQSVALAELRGDVVRERRSAKPGMRLVAAPDFVIIGAQRGGTTSLHAYLNAHPQVHTPATKELHFITDRYARGRDWYVGQFPTLLTPRALTGESTPYALFHPLSPHRLRAIAPHAKLIVLLRNPVDRAYSHYLLERSRGDEMLSFEEALAAEAPRLSGAEARLIADPTYVSAAHKHASYLARGNYAPQLARWFTAYPREQFLIVRSEDLYEKTEETYAKVTRFLGLPADADVAFAVHNQTSGPQLDPAIRDRLSQHFVPLNERLSRLLGWESSW